MPEVRIQERDNHWSWQLTTTDGAEILARSARRYTDREGCWRSARAAIAGGDCAFALLGADGLWWWEVGDEDGGTLARSGEAYGSARACGVALHRFQLAALILGPSYERRPARAATAPCRAR